MVFRYSYDWSSKFIQTSKPLRPNLTSNFVTTMYYKKLGNVTPQPTKHPLSQPLHRIDVWVLPNPLTHLRIICWIPILMADRIPFIFPHPLKSCFFNMQQPEMPRFYSSGSRLPLVSQPTNHHLIRPKNHLPHVSPRFRIEKNQAIGANEIQACASRLWR